MTRDRFGLLEHHGCVKSSSDSTHKAADTASFGEFCFLVALPPVPDLFLFAKPLFGAAIAEGDAASLPAVRSATQVR
jgi:hypothetical protein